MVKKTKRSEGQITISRGTLKGRKITFPNLDDLRPTPLRVREAVFSMIHPTVKSHAFVDLFCGSGGMAFEAWSCGFRPIYYAESNAAARESLKRNSARMGVEVLGAFATAVELIEHLKEKLSGAERPFLFYADPPYRNYMNSSALIHKLFEPPLFPEGSLLLIEHEKGTTTPFHPRLIIKKEKKYGRSLVSQCLLT
ncbi:MAG: hypothetical protein CR997_05240 [Acidobacteria bacterium]|nr:MAG: hypothetical protein CR997_05240 [Acidobacteriota bacterium]